jgi:hypothetical protein
MTTYGPATAVDLPTVSRVVEATKEAWRPALGASQIRDYYSLSDGSQSSISLPSGSLSHAKFP